jgi:hypothetical protein
MTIRVELEGAIMLDDINMLSEWWCSLLANAGPPPVGVEALWFGLVELIDNDSVGWHLYVAGCDSFDPNDETGDWACEPIWLPEGRYVYLAGLNEHASAPHLEMLSYVADLVRSLSPQQTWPTQLNGVATGFDGGDFIVTWASS